MPADESVYRAIANIALCAAVLVPHAKTRAGYYGQTPWRARSLVTAINRFVQLYWILDAHKGIDADAIAIANETNRLVRRHNLKHSHPSLL